MDHVYKTIELTGSSKRGIEDAIQTAIARADETLRKLRWFEVSDIRGQLVDGKVEYWQVSVKVGLSLEESD